MADDIRTVIRQLRGGASGLTRATLRFRADQTPAPADDVADLLDMVAGFPAG